MAQDRRSKLFLHRSAAERDALTFFQDTLEGGSKAPVRRGKPGASEAPLPELGPRLRRIIEASATPLPPEAPLPELPPRLQRIIEASAIPLPPAPPIVPSTPRISSALSSHFSLFGYLALALGSASAATWGSFDFSPKESVQAVTELETSKVRQESDNTREVETSNELKVRLDLGEWPVSRVNALLKEASKLEDPNERMTFIMLSFRGTPFVYESESTVQPERDEILVKLSSFDCITFIYYMTALHQSKNFDEFVRNLAAIRYRDVESLGIDSDHYSGNIYDYTENALIENALVERGMFEDMTDQILGQVGVNPYISERTLATTKTEARVGGHMVRPKNASNSLSQDFTMNFIPAESVEQAESLIKTGDVIVFAKEKRTKEELEQGHIELGIGHGAIAVKGSDLPQDLREKNNIPSDSSRIYFVHSSLTNAVNDTLTGIDFAGTRLGPQNYDSAQPRLLTDYCQWSKFKGIAILRPQNPSSPLVVAINE